MSTLKELLKDVPVEWKELNNVIVSLKTGLNPRKNFSLNSDNAQGYYVTVREIVNGKVVFFDKTDRVSFDALEIINNRSNLTAGDILFSGTGTVGRIAVIDIAPINWNIKEGVYAIKPKKEILNSKYLGYLLSSEHIVHTYSKKIVGSPVVSLPMKDLRKLQIPIPYPNNPEKSLAIQEEIVRILDELTEQKNALNEALTTEIENRKKQYDFYREQLFQFEGKEVEWKTLGEIGEVKMCKRIFKNETTDNGDIPFYKIGTFGKVADSFISEELYELYKSKYSYPKLGTVLISAAGTIGRTVVYDGKPAYFQDSNIIWLDNDETILTNRYLQHYYKIAKWFVSGGGTIDRLYNDNVRRTKISVPFPNDKEKSLTEQQRIVNLLDKFDETSKAIITELEKEIELRNKQYEYYRNQLLTFPVIANRR